MSVLLIYFKRDAIISTAIVGIDTVTIGKSGLALSGLKCLWGVSSEQLLYTLLIINIIVL